MEENRKGFILSAAEAPLANAPDKCKVLNEKRQKKTIKSEGDPKLIKIYMMLRPSAEYTQLQPEPSIYTWISLETIYPGGCIDEFYFNYSAEVPIYDHVSYLASGRVRVTYGDRAKTIGPDTLCYFPSNLKYSLTNVGKLPANFVNVNTQVAGKKMGEPIYSKMPTWIGEHNRKLAGNTEQLEKDAKEANRKGFILSAAEVKPSKFPNKIMVLNEKGQIQIVKREYDPKLWLEVYPLLSTAAEFTKLQPGHSIHTSITLEKMQPGGSLDEHYNEYNTRLQVYDHLFYVLSGRMRATIGDIEKTVGADTLIYCPSNVRHSLSNVGKRIAKYLTIRGAAEGAKMGGPVYLKKPTWHLEAGINK
jgi:mannose-6-phosphate isomerase-like protein (cupin superfamily)